MSNLSPADLSTVAKLLGLIGSHHDAEALAAARKAHELLKAKGATWPEALGIDDVRQAMPELQHVAMARDLLGRGKGIITRWERDFLTGIMSHKNPSLHQRQTLDGIAAKIDAATS